MDWVIGRGSASDDLGELKVRCTIVRYGSQAGMLFQGHARKAFMRIQSIAEPSATNSKSAFSVVADAHLW